MNREDEVRFLLHFNAHGVGVPLVASFPNGIVTALLAARAPDPTRGDMVAPAFTRYCGCGRAHAHQVLLLCAGRVPVVPVHTTAAMCGTVVRSSLGLAGLPQWSQAQAYASNVYWFTPVSSCCSRQTQGVMGAALNRQRKL